MRKPIDTKGRTRRPTPRQAPDHAVDAPQEDERRRRWANRIHSGDQERNDRGSQGKKPTPRKRGSK